MEYYNLVVCGGTFDYLHSGHKAFLRFMFPRCKKILLGLTSDAYAKGKNTEIDAFAKRKEALEAFIASEGVKEKVEIKAIDTVYIPTEWEQLPIDAIVVSKETKKGAVLINQEREKRDLSVLPVIVVQPVLAEDGNIISSTRIRHGEITREGKLWLNPLWFKKTLQLTQEQRSKLTHPFGELINNFSKWYKKQVISPDKLITVGDVITKSCNELGIRQKIAVIDFHTQRKRTFTHNRELGFEGNEKVFPVGNPKSHVTAALFQLTKHIFSTLSQHKRIIVEVEGEEDLSVLPFLLAAPLGFIILYGQPQQGVVRIDVTEETKEKAFSLVNEFIVL